MIRVVDGDLLEAKSPYIGHQVNCMGVMGSGVARAIRSKHPEVYHAYKDFCEHNKGYLLGKVLYVITDSGRVVCNLFAQENFGTDGKCYTDYDALRECLETLRDDISTGYEIALPYLIGCYRGGGDWGIVYPMLEDIFVAHNLVLYRKDVG